MNFDLNYEIQAEEMAQATSDFLLDRPIVKISYRLMQFCCIFICCGIIIKFYFAKLILNDYMFFIFASSWLLFGRKINLHLVAFLYKKRKSTTTYTCTVTETNVTVKIGNTSIQQPWKQVKKILKNQFGFIVPIIGYNNGGKFIWLPFRVMTKNQLDSLHSFFSKQNIQLKTLATNDKDATLQTV